MATAEQIDLKEYCIDVARKAHESAYRMANASGERKNRWLRRAAVLLREKAAELESANAEDLAAAADHGLTPAQIDRLTLNPKTIESMALGLEEIAMLPDPVGEIVDSSTRPNGLQVQKVRVPLGVVFFIYESRPNVTADAAAICLKSGNSVILRGGKESRNSNLAISRLLWEACDEVGLPASSIQFVETTDREAVGHFLRLDEFIQVAIPRGGESLIRRVANEARMPVIKHYAGNCHVYVDRHADKDMAVKVTLNSKCQRYGVCNAAESLLIHADVAAEMAPGLCGALAQQGVEIRADERTRELFPSAVPAVQEDFSTEFLAPIISVKVVESLDAAIDHIHRYGSGHTETIITSDYATARAFAARVDSSAVIVNASTRFNDGAQFGLGAEIGISTDKFHARGPCGLRELTSYKYVVFGDGQVRT